ncbi:Predicted phospholipase, patatin/cPLA2 family [Pelagirhabdus alkalitolerans]|uniref:Predicted phospholipase, patatin/cPLA2 family n=1 Tax=Pelagirhabdus alkalitolerans TaxID=1612202 RepID=A0A1G6IMN7_9BACI|nr:patatin family protein [Pelagirhabdus alkalitolerans]SDC07026.1 Predicted phospholipase, patatin/cPLA2 family [Pelagirhabdus alkalitolerans]
MLENTGLVLEGGGMRGVYTSGVLDGFMDHDLYFPYVIGVSAGACNALSYLSRQKDRSRYINVNYANDPRYINYKNLLRGEGIFNMEFLFNDITNDLVPFDFETFEQRAERLVVPTTDCKTGEALYFEESESKQIIEAVRASSSLPLVGKPVNLGSHTLLDGGIADPIPIQKSIEDGNERHVIILTRPKGYRKKPFRARMTARLIYPKYKELVKALERRHQIYNDTLDYIDELEENGHALVIRPKGEEQVGRAEKDAEKLNGLHRAGYQSAEDHVDRLKDWLQLNPV